MEILFRPVIILSFISIILHFRRYSKYKNEFKHNYTISTIFQPRGRFICNIPLLLFFSGMGSTNGWLRADIKGKLLQPHKQQE